MFIDTATIKVRAGKGGNGASSFRHERMVAKGGPDGGDGGKGGDVLFIADHNLNTLAEFRHLPLVTAEDGQAGGHRKQHGKNGEDQIVRVPVGTMVNWGDQVLADLTLDKQQLVAAKGGKGGFGNAHFTSSVRRRPDVAELGEPGEETEVSLELKLLADVGLVGLPNAGKSTLLSVVSNAKPAIANYPFTTKTPNLGVVSIDEDSFLMADIPGLIEGASQGKGLGDEFLRHIERTSVILHLVDSTSEGVVKDWQVVMKELKSYPTDLSKRPQMVVLTKCETLPAAKIAAKQTQLAKATKLPVLSISAVAHHGVLELLREVVKLVKTTRQAAKRRPKAKSEPVVLTLADDPTAWWIEKNHGAFEVKGQKIEGFAKRTNFGQESGLARLRHIMGRLGISRELVRLGVRVDDTIRIANKTFKW